MTTNYVYSGSSSTGGEEWVCFNMNVDAAFNALIAKHGFIENLTGHELVITDVNEPVAGMTSGSATSDSSEINGVNRGSVRIWAGTPTDNNLYNCPFYVTNTGELHSTKAVISGDVTISGSIYGTAVMLKTPVYTYNRASLRVLQSPNGGEILKFSTLSNVVYQILSNEDGGPIIVKNLSTNLVERYENDTNEKEQLESNRLETTNGTGYLIITGKVTQIDSLKLLPPAKTCPGAVTTVAYYCSNSTKVAPIGSAYSSDMVESFSDGGTSNNSYHYVSLDANKCITFISDGKNWLAIQKTDVVTAGFTDSINSL